MTALKTLVVEDEGLSRRRLEKLVEAHDKLILISDSAQTGVQALEKIKKYQPDLILFDIELKDFNAFEILSKLEDVNSRIIFITAFSDYAVKAFEVEAVDYLLKPFTEERFKMAVNKVISRQDDLGLEGLKEALLKGFPENPKRLIIPEGNTQHYLSGDLVKYICAQGYYANIVMRDQKKLVRISLKTLEKKLPPSFFRINRSTIINNHYIKEIIKNKASLKIIMTDKNDFYVSEKYKVKVEATLLKLN